MQTPEQDSYIRFSFTNLSRRQCSWKPIQSISQPQGTHKKGWGRPRTLRLKHFPQLVGDLGPNSCLPTLLSVRDITVWTSNSLFCSKYLSFCISLLSPIYWLNVLKTGFIIHLFLSPWIIIHTKRKSIKKKSLKKATASNYPKLGIYLRYAGTSLIQIRCLTLGRHRRSSLLLLMILGNEPCSALVSTYSYYACLKDQGKSSWPRFKPLL